MDRRIACALFLLAAVAWFALTPAEYTPGNWNDASRLAAIESLVHRGTWQIDDSPYLKWTGDKLFLNGHWYSTKPPLLQALSTLPYSISERVARPVLSNGEDELGAPGEELDYRLLAFLTVGLPSALLIALVYLVARRLGASRSHSVLAAALLALGTAVLPYSLVLNNHIPAAVMLLAGFWFVLGGATILAGFCAALAVSFDLSAAIIALALFAMVARRRAAGALWFALGALPPALATAALDHAITGSILPPYFATQGYSYAGSNWTATVAALKVPADLAGYAFRSLVGDRGLFSHSPLLLWGLAGLAIAAVSVRARRDNQGEASVPAPPALGGYRSESLILAIGIVAQTAYVLVTTDNFGGRAYGARWFLVWIPLVAAYLPFALARRPSETPSAAPSPARSERGPGVRVFPGYVNTLLLACAVLLSVASAAQGVADPWSSSHPPVYLSSQGIRTELPRRVDPAAVRRWLACPRWELPAQPTFGTPRGATRLDAQFAGRVLIVGYDLPAASRRVQPGDSFPLKLYWKALGAIDEDYRLFVRLLDVDGVKRGGQDRRPASSDTRCWEPGEVLRDEFRVPVFAGAPHGVYTLQVGMYVPPAEHGEYLPLHLDGRPVEVYDVSLGAIKVGGPPDGATAAGCDPAQALDVPFGGGAIRLAGYDLAREPGALRLGLCWRSAGATPTDYTVFVHLAKADGRPVAGMDRPPAAGRYPTSLWDAGDVVPGELVLPLPDDLPVGDYALLVGLYDPITGARLAVPGSSDGSLRLETVRIPDGD